MKNRLRIILVTAIATVSSVGVSHAATVVIDSFSAPSGGVTINDNNGSPDYHNYIGPSVVGGRRELRVRDGHSATIGCCTALSIDNSAGTLTYWGGGTAPEQWSNYGTALQNASPVELNLSKTLASSLEIDVLSNNLGSSFIVELLTGYGNISHTVSNIPVGTTNVPLSSIAGMTEQQAGDIDGIRLRSAVTSASLADGLVVSEVRLMPEPSAVSLLMIACVGLFGYRNRRSAV